MAWDPRKASPPAWTNYPPAAPPVPMAPPAPVWPGAPSPEPPPNAAPLPPAQPLGPFHEAHSAGPPPAPTAGAPQPQSPERHSRFIRFLLNLRAGLAQFFRRLWPSQATAPDWGPTSLGFSAPLAAFLAYLGWWFTGVIVYFNERQNRYVRFHAYQSIVFTGLLSIVSVLGYVAASLCNDVFLATHQPVFQTFARGIAAAVLLGVLFAWFIPLIAAATGYKLRIPFIAPYAERYSQPFATATPDASDEH